MEVHGVAVEVHRKALGDKRRHVHGVALELTIVDEGVQIHAEVRTADRTGVEMEALTAVTVAALAIVDMVKGVDRRAEILHARVTAKSGGRSGDWTRNAD